MTIEQLRDRCAYWQKVLRLQDWDIQLSLVRQWDVPDAFGTCDANLIKKIARIKILDPVDDGDPHDYEEYDAEKTLVHELLHVHFEPFAKKDDSPEETAQHQVVHVLAYALVGLDRQRFGPVTTVPKMQPIVTGAQVTSTLAVNGCTTVGAI